MTEAVHPRFMRPLKAPNEDLGEVLRLGPTDPLVLDSGKRLTPLTIAYMTYGTLNAERSNAVLIGHALSGDQFVASTHPVTGKPGWWDIVVGPGKPIDTDRFFVICANVVGGCMGTTGPSDINPATDEPYGLKFPVVTIRDMVRAQAMLLDALGIEQVLCVLGGSMGGMQVLQWAASYPERVFSAMPIATAARHSAQNIAFNEVGRQAIMADPDWRGGNYALSDVNPSKGLAVARMAAHITYLSEAALQRKFGRTLQNRDAVSFGFDADFQIESYLRHQGMTFVDRFDANSYLYITRAMDYFDLAADYGGVLAEAFRGSKSTILPRLLHQRLAVPDEREQAHRARAQCGRRQCQLRRDRKRPRPRRLPARRARAVRHDPRLPERGGLHQGREMNASPKAGPGIALRPDLAAIAAMIPPSTRVLDIGCGDGALLEYLVRVKGVDGRGLELIQQNVNQCVARGLSVVQGDADTDLTEYPSGVFDIVILSQTIQTTRRPRFVIEELLRIGKRTIVSFPNFGHWRVRMSLATRGRMPVTKALGHAWHDTPNIHLCTIDDFLSLASEVGAHIEQAWTLHDGKAPQPMRPAAWGPNLFAQGAIFLLAKN